jgi:hypothetical protein
LRKCDFLSGKVRDWPDPDPKLIIPDPDPAKKFRIRIHNTASSSSILPPKSFLLDPS